MINVTFSIKFPTHEMVDGTTLKVEMPVLPEVGGDVYLCDNELKKDGLHGMGKVLSITPCIIECGHVHYLVKVDVYKLDKDGWPMDSA